MSEDFKVKIGAEVDLSDVEKKVKDFTNKEHKVKIETDIPDLDKELGKKKPKDIEVGTKVIGAENVNKLKNGLAGAKKSADGLSNSFKSISKIGLQIDLFCEIEQQAKKAVQALKEIDDAIVDLQMATNLSYNNVRNMMSGYNDMAKQLGATTTEVSSGADTWLRQGKTIAETNKLVKDTMVLSKVAQMSSEDSSKVLTATLNGYQMAAEQAEYVNDILSSIDLESAADAGGLGTSLGKVASMANNVGLSIEKTVASLATMKDATQDSDESIGNALKSVLSRMNQIKAGKFIDSETGEALNDTEKVLNKVGISMRNVNGQFLESEIIMDNVGQKWSTFDGNTKKAVATAMAGTYQYNKLISLFDNYNKVLKLTETAQNSAGTSAKKFEDNYLNSLESKQKKLQASFESLAFNAVSRETYGGIVDATTALVEFIDKTNLVKGALAGLTVGGITKGFLAIKTGIVDAAMHMQNFQKSLDLLKLGNIDGNGIQQLGSYIEGLSNSQLKAVLSSEQLTAAQRMQILQASGMSKASAEATLATMGLSAANTTATGTTLSLGTALKGLWSTLLANPIILVGMAVTAGVSIWSSYKQSVEEALSSARNAGQSFQENTSSLNQQISKVQELKSALASGTLSEQEAASAKSQLLDIQNQLVSTYGEEAEGIDLVNDSLEKQLSLMNELAVQDANKYLNENKEGIDKATKEMEKDRHFYLGEFNPQTDEGKQLENLIEKYKELGLSMSVMQGGLSSITFDGNVSEASDVVNAFLTDVRKLSEKTGDEYGFLDGIETYASKELGEVNETIEEYGEIYNAALQSDMISKGFGENSPATIYKEYGETIQEYNAALASGDTSQIEKAKASFDQVQGSVNGVLKQYPEYKVLFDEIGNSLNESAVKAKEFEAALKGDGFEDVLKQFKDLKDVDLKGMNFTDDVSSNAEKALEQVVNKAIELGIVSDDSAESIATVVDLLVDMGLTASQSVESLNQSFSQANNSIQKATSNIEKLKGILSESTSGGGLSAESVEAFKDMFGKDAETALERTANGYHINKEALADLQKQQEEMTETDYLNALNNQFTALRDVEAQLATAQLFERDTSGLEASRNEILDNISTLEELQYQYEAATSAYQQWQSAMSGGEAGDMYDSIFGNLESVQELYDKNLVGTNKFREFTDLISNQDLSNASTEQIVAAYEAAIPKIRRYFTEGQEGAERFLQDVHNLNSEWAHMNEDGSWEINFGANNDQEIADKLGIDVEMVQAIMRKLSDYGFDINLDQPIASMEELKSQAEQAKESLGDMEVNLNVDTFEGVDGEIRKVQEYIENLNNSEISPEVRADKLEEANSILEYLLSRKQELGQSENIDVAISVDESELNAGYAVLANLKSSLENMHGSVGLDYQGFQSEVNACMAQVEAMSPEMKVALNIQGMSEEEIKAGLMNGSIKIPVSADTAKAKSDVQNVENQNINQKNFKVTAHTLQATTALAGVRSSLASIKSKTVTVTVNRIENNGGAHKLSGTAHASGTAYASGNWSNPRTQTALVGERGREIVVDPHTGHWYTVGDSGAEFRQIPQGAIVFNDVQTEALLKNGRIDGRGKALMSGTAYSSGSGSFGGGKGTSSSSSKKKSTSSKSSTKSKTSKSKSDAEKATEEVLDHIATLLKRVARQTEIAVDAIENAIGLANKQTATANAISKVQAEIAKNQQAKNAYMNKANSVGLSSDYVNKIKNGSLNIETITDESLKEKISDYTKWLAFQPHNLFNCGKIPTILSCYNVTGNGKRECGTSL